MMLSASSVCVKEGVDKCDQTVCLLCIIVSNVCYYLGLCKHLAVNHHIFTNINVANKLCGLFVGFYTNKRGHL